MKKYIYLFLLFVIVGGVLTIHYQSKKIKNVEQLYQKELLNVEAYQIQNSNLKGEIRQYQMTIDELNNSKDSIDKKLISVMKSLKVSDKKVKEIQYQLNRFDKVDTVTFRDTIFVNSIDIDTVIADNWYTLNVKMNYPSTLIVNPTMTSEQYVYIHNSKEYVGGKSKIFFINWFKKKYTVTNITTEELNPYINTINQKFIQVK